MMTNDELRQAMAALPEPDGDDFWSDKLRDIRRRIIDDGPEAFLTWPSIVSTMFVGHQAPYIARERAAMPGRCIVDDPGIGRPAMDGTTSGNYIHQAYHLWRWERHTGRYIKDVSSVVEFGGGYGALAVIARRLGFTGYWGILDLPVMRLIQDWYLERAGVPPATMARTPAPDLYIALYSLHEAPEPVWRSQLARISSDYVLIASSQGAPAFNAAVRAVESYIWTQANIDDPYTCYLFGQRAKSPQLAKKKGGKR